MSGFVVHPVAASTRITSPFGPRTHPVTGKQSTHLGVDFAAAEGTPLVAVDAGRVVAVNTNPNNSGGLIVVMQRADGVRWTYMHMSRIDVHAGQELKAGERVGLAGATGKRTLDDGRVVPSVTGPHLHFEVSVGGRQVDPMQFLGAGGGAGLLVLLATAAGVGMLL